MLMFGVSLAMGYALFHRYELALVAVVVAVLGAAWTYT